MYSVCNSACNSARENSAAADSPLGPSISSRFLNGGGGRERRAGFPALIHARKIGRKPSIASRARASSRPRVLGPRRGTGAGAGGEAVVKIVIFIIFYILL